MNSAEPNGSSSREANPAGSMVRASAEKAAKVVYALANSSGWVARVQCSPGASGPHPASLAPCNQKTSPGLKTWLTDGAQTHPRVLLIAHRP